MASNSSWVPDESPQTLFAERCWLQGAILSAAAYGITLPLYVLSFQLLHNSNRIKKRWPLLIYLAASFLLGTLFIITNTAFTQMAFIDDRNYPGGPNAFENTFFSIPVDDVGNAAFVLSNWLSDVLVVWRFKVIYQQPMYQVPIWVMMLLPCLMLAGSMALGIMFLIQLSTTNPYVVAMNNVNFTLPYISLSLALNIILTIAIVLRLLVFRYRIVSVLGPGYGMHYTSIAAMTIESAALYSAVCITLLVLFGIGNASSRVFAQSLSQFQTIATLLIVFRVAQGKAWTRETASYVMTARRIELPELGRLHLVSSGIAGSLTMPATSFVEV